MKKSVLIATLFVVTISFANQSSNGQGQREMRKPPQEAITICEGQDEGNSCNITTPRGDTQDGTCKNTPDGKYFVCMPLNMKNSRPSQNR